MDILKKILKISFEQNVNLVTTSINNKVEFISFKNPSNVYEELVMSQGDFKSIFNFIFKTDLEQTTTSVKQTMTIPNFGEVKVIFNKSAKNTVTYYLPNNSDEFIKGEWDKINNVDLKDESISSSEISIPPPISVAPIDKKTPNASVEPTGLVSPLQSIDPINVPHADNRPSELTAEVDENFEQPPLSVDFGKINISANNTQTADVVKTESLKPQSTIPLVDNIQIPVREDQVVQDTIPDIDLEEQHKDELQITPPFLTDNSLAQDTDSNISNDFSLNLNEFDKQDVQLSSSKPQEDNLYSMPAESILANNNSEEIQGEINFGTIADDLSVSDGSNPIDAVLIEMIDKKASDLHLTLGQNIIFRIDGDINRQEGEALSEQRMGSLLDPIIPKKNKSEFLADNDSDFAYEIKEVGRFRVNIYRDINGVGCVIRHIPSEILSADQLNLPEAITNLCKLHKGLVLVTGPTGSGKSTTLAAMIDKINKERKDHILTIEDPIEFVHPQYQAIVNQREIKKHTTSFSRALKAALREDPDVVLIGELRDLETVAIAIETAETGHLVFGTLHTTTAISTVDRIIDQFPATQQEQIKVMLATSLKGVVSQTLLKKNGGGRVAAQEILIVDSAVSSLIRESKNHMIANHMQTQRKSGNILLNKALLDLTTQGVVAPEEALNKSISKSELEDAFRQNKIKVAS